MTEKEFFGTVRRIEEAIKFIATNGEIESILEKIDRIQRFLNKFGSLSELIEHLECMEKYIFYGKETLTVEESAIYLGLSKSTMYKMTSSGELTLSKPNGKKAYIKKAELDRWMNQNVLLSDEENMRLAEMKADELRKKFAKGKSFIK